MSDVLPFIITGIVSGSLYGLAGLGLVLTYRTSGVFNFGHGAIGAGAAYLFYTLHDQHHVPWPIAALVVLAVFAGVLGWGLELITRGLGDVPEAVVVVATVGILLGGEGILYLHYGDVTRTMPNFLPTSGFTTSGVNVTWAQVISVTLATVSAAGLYVFLRRSRLGIAMRAVVDNPTLLALSGDNPRRVRRSAWAIGSAFAALSGILLAPTLGLDPTLLSLLVVQAFGACAIGFFTSLPLTYAGGITVGVAASLATKYFTSAPFNGVPAAVPFLVLFVVILVVPKSRFPKKQASLRSLIPNVAPMSRRTGVVLAAGGLAALIIVPQVVGTYLPVWITGLIDITVFASLGLLVWGSGQISLCHAAFVAVGVCSMGHLDHNDHLPWAFAVLLSGLLTIPVGAVVALPAIRLSGIYLALATLGFGILMQDVVFPTSIMFGSGLTAYAARPQLGFLHGAVDKDFYYVVLAITIASVVAIVVIGRTRLGRLSRALSEAPTMLSTHGLGVNATRLIVFCVSAFFAGIAGALTVSQFGSAAGIGYGPIQSLLFLAVLAICGTRLLRSAVLAGGLVAVLPGYMHTLSSDRQLLAFGLVAIGASVAIANREGLRQWFSSPQTSPAGRSAATVRPSRYTQPVRVQQKVPASVVSHPRGRMPRSDRIR